MQVVVGNFDSHNLLSVWGAFANVVLRMHPLPTQYLLFIWHLQSLLVNSNTVSRASSIRSRCRRRSNNLWHGTREKGHYIHATGISTLQGTSHGYGNLSDIIYHGSENIDSVSSLREVQKLPLGLPGLKMISRLQ